MGARVRGRRKIAVGGRPYLWYVAQDEDGTGPVLHAFSQDKRLVVVYWIGGSRGYPASPVLNLSVDGVCRWVTDIPDWEPCSVATPRLVAEIIAWAVGRAVG
jgi:hypothetical protein